MGNSLNELLTREKIIVIDSVDKWEDAVRKGSQVLVDQEKIEDSYVQAMIDSVYRNGPYMVLADYFALMHARPDDGVNETALSLIKLNQETLMEGEPVKVFLILAAKDNKSHIMALSQITNLLSNEEIFNSIIDGDKDQISRLLKGGEK